ncbi:ABC transporter permease [Brachybacterium sp. AOP43-C2-M15]|uniref:ABC transporter permease n=1 Tax=Brachybacterium sp. AOP43-C2-M15 TaxID=3457661 RepID=UPI00403398E9
MTPRPETLPGQDHFVAPAEEVTLKAVDAVDTEREPRSLWGEAWHSLIRNPVFLVSGMLIVFILIVTLLPTLFTSQDPRYCVLANSYGGPQPGHPFGFDKQGCDVYARVIYGARASVSVGVLTTLGVVILGGMIGAIAGFFGGWFDAVLSRFTDIFFAVPLVLGAIVIMQLFKQHAGVMLLVAVMVVFGWTAIARIARSSVMSVKNAEFVTAATALGAGRFTNLLRHILPNAVAPVIVTATVNLGVYIVVEATLSFLGVGLPDSSVSWGMDISKAQSSLRDRPTLLFYPAGALAITVLSFIMMGDAVRDVLDPKAKKR